MKKSEKDKLLDIYVKMNDKRVFTDNSVFELNDLVSVAIEIIENIDKGSTCYKNLLKSKEISTEYHKISFNNMTQTVTNKYAMDIIQLSQYSIKEFAEKY